MELRGILNGSYVSWRLLNIKGGLCHCFSYCVKFIRALKIYIYIKNTENIFCICKIF